MSPIDTRIATCGGYHCLVHPGVRDKHRVSEIDLSQPRHETAFWWRHYGPVTSQLTDPIKWPNHPLEFIVIYVHIYIHTTKNPWHKDVIDRQMYDCVGYFCTYPYGLSLNGWRALLCIANNRHGVTITTHATKRHFLIWMTTVRQPTKRRRSCVYLKIHFYLCLLVNETKNPQHLDCGRSISATHGGGGGGGWNDSRLGGGIDLPHQGVMDSYKQE